MRSLAAALAGAMGRRYGGGMNIIGWHLDNEHGDEPDCHCPVCRAKFQQWCAEGYGTIGALNMAWGLAFWGLRFDASEQIPTPRVTKAFHGPGHLQAWHRFRSGSTIAAAQIQGDALRPDLGENQFITTNNQPSWPPRTDYYDMAQHLDVAGMNCYPQYGSGAMPLGIGRGAAHKR